MSNKLDVNKIILELISRLQSAEKYYRKMKKNAHKLTKYKIFNTTMTCKLRSGA